MKTKIIYAALVISAMPVSFTSCTSDDPDNSKTLTRFEPIPFTSGERGIIDAAKPFALDLFRTYCAQSENPNVVLSPLSAIIDLGMLANGASGETQGEILETLGWGSTGLEEMNSYARRLLSGYRDMDRTADVSIANGIFNRRDRLGVKNEYAGKMRSVYDAHLQSFGDEDWDKGLSKWISDKSGGLIKDMDLGYKDADLSLLNVLYFKGIWTDPFDKSKTKTGEFANSDGSIKEVDYLCDRRNVRVYQNGVFTSVLLAFGNGAYNIEFLKADEEKGLDACLGELDNDMWNSLHSNGESLKVNLRIPKFDVAMVLNLKKALMELGINRAFGTNAQLDNMLDSGSGEVSVTSVKQGCSFSIDEDGVTASAATAENIGETAPPPLRDGGDFFLDHPFVFAIRENSSGAILFMGKIGKL